MKYPIALALVLGTATLVACEANQETPEAQEEAAQGNVVTLAISGMT